MYGGSEPRNYPRNSEVSAPSGREELNSREYFAQDWILRGPGIGRHSLRTQTYLRSQAKGDIAAETGCFPEYLPISADGKYLVQKGKFW